MGIAKEEFVYVMKVTMARTVLFKFAIRAFHIFHKQMIHVNLIALILESGTTI